MAVVPYAVVEWISEGGRTPNELRVWLEEMMRIYGNYQREDWELFYKFTMAAAKMYPNERKRIVLAMEMGPVTATDPKFWKWEDQRLVAILGTRPTIYLVTNRGGTSHIDKSLWENLKRVMGSGIGAMNQAQQSQHQPTASPIAQTGHREFYSDW